MVRVFLPLHPSHATATAAEPVSTVGVRAARGGVLVVEDEPGVRRLLSRYLGGLGYDVQEAVDGVAALEHIHHSGRQVDLVLTDLVMPRMGGVELIRRIRVIRPALPVLCMSGTPGGLEEGEEPWTADRVIAKPMELEVVATRIAAAMETIR